MNKTTQNTTIAINPDLIAVLSMTGKDVVSFLNNQTVSELSRLTGITLYTVICNPKGRIIFSLIISSYEHETLVAVDATMKEQFIQYVNMRKFRMAVTVTDAPQILTIETKKEASNDTGNLPIDFSKDIKFITHESKDFSADEVFWQSMFNSGMPWINITSSEKFIPQHLNLDQHGVIDFDKGCYPGQEIVARLHYLGNVKKRMNYIQYNSQTPHENLSNIELEAFTSKLELCSPSIHIGGQWHAQAIKKLNK